MRRFLEEDLASQGIDTKTSLKIEFENKVYLRAKTLPRQFYAKAAELKEKYLSQNLASLLIEHKTWITVWVEESKKREETANNDWYQVQELSISELEVEESGTKQIDQEEESETVVEYLDNQTPSDQEKLAIKKMTKKYRGVDYEVEVSQADSSSITQVNKQKLKKYRGRYY